MALRSCVGVEGWWGGGGGVEEKGRGRPSEMKPSSVYTTAFRRAVDLPSPSPTPYPTHFLREGGREGGKGGARHWCGHFAVLSYRFRRNPSFGLLFFGDVYDCATKAT